MCETPCAVLTLQDVDSVSGDLGDCADKNNETFANRHSGRPLRAFRWVLTLQEDNILDQFRR